MSATDSNESRFNIAPVFRRARLVRILFEFGVGILFLKSSTLAADNFSFELAEDQFPVLEQVLSEAAAESPLMLEEALRIRSAKAEERIAASGRLPSVSASFRYLGRIED